MHNEDRKKFLPVLASLASPDDQADLWMDPDRKSINLKDACIWVNLLWSNHLEEIQENEAAILTQEENRCMLPLRRAILGVLSKYDSAYDAPQILQDPDWPKVIRCAKDALQVLSSQAQGGVEE